MPAERDGKILVVDDENLVRWSLCRHLESLGYQVMGAGSCIEALALFQRESPFSLLITDLTMPDLDGFELMRRVSTLYPETRFLVITGNPSPEAVERARGAGALQTFEKPLDFGAIGSTVENLV